MKNKYTIADILHYAADHMLASKETECWYAKGIKEKYSCCAVGKAMKMLQSEIDFSEGVDFSLKDIMQGLENMGCEPIGLNLFEKPSSSEQENFVQENQQSRYAWLKFAAMMAEEQGV